MESNPFFDLCTNLSDVKGTPVEIEGSLFGSAFGGMNQPLPEPMEDISVDVECTLVEFYCGARKQVDYERQVIGLDGTTVRQELNTVDVFVTPGMKKNTKITFHSQGNQQLKRKPTDLHITFKLKDSQPGSNSANYSRKGDSCDLYYTHKVKLVEALQCKPIMLTTLDGRNLAIAVDHFMVPGTVKCVENEGLPICVYDPKEVKKDFDLLCPRAHKKERGDLYILFDVEFPTTLSREQKSEIERIIKC